MARKQREQIEKVEADMKNVEAELAGLLADETDAEGDDRSAPAAEAPPPVEPTAPPPATTSAPPTDQLSDLLVSETEASTGESSPGAEPSAQPESTLSVVPVVVEGATVTVPASEVPSATPSRREPQDDEEEAALARGEQLDDKPAEGGESDGLLPEGAVVVGKGTRLLLGGHMFTLCFDTPGLLDGISTEEERVAVLSKDRVNFDANKHLFEHDYNPVTGARIEPLAKG
jgi:hypothetical protein